MAALPAKVVLDTSIYLSFLERSQRIYDLSFLERPSLLYMSSVVFAELYVGARDRTTIRQLERLYRTFDRLGRIVTPDKQVWFEVAQVLQRIRLRDGFETTGLTRLTHDALIALSARKIGAVVVTRNQKDFERIREQRDFQLKVDMD